MLAYSRGKVFCYQSMLNHQSVMPCPSSMLYLHLHLKYTDSSSSSMSQIRSSSSSTITETRSVEPPRRNFPRWLRQLEDPAHIPIFSDLRRSATSKIASFVNAGLLSGEQASVAVEHFGAAAHGLFAVEMWLGLMDDKKIDYIKSLRRQDTKQLKLTPRRSI